MHWLLLHRPSVEWNAETAALLDTYHLILEQIIASSPSCLEIPNILGHTPLHIAVYVFCSVFYDASLIRLFTPIKHARKSSGDSYLVEKWR